MLKNILEHFVYRDNVDDFRRKSKTILISCFAYLLPALYIIYSPLKKYNILVFIAFLQVLLSVLSDFVFIESNEKHSKIIDVVDRINSIIYTAFILILLIRNHFIFSMVNVSLTILLIEYSRCSKNQEEWIKRHTLWHFASSIILLVCLEQINN